MPPGSGKFSLKPNRFSGDENVTVGLDPAIRFGWHHLSHFSPDDVRNAGVGGERRIGYYMDVIAHRPVRPVQKLNNAEAFIHRLEERAISLLTLAQRGRRGDSLYVGPRSFRSFTHQAHLVVGPIPRGSVVDGHHRPKPAFLHER